MLENIPPEVWIVIGVILIAASIWQYSYGKATLNWPTAKGKVTISYVETKVHHGQGRSKTSKTHTLGYEYEVDGNLYGGSRIRFGFIGESATIRFQKYGPEKPVNVRYKPSKPSVCCLEPGIDWSVYIALPVGAAILLLGALNL